MSVVFLELYAKGSSSLSNIFHVRVRACEPVDSTFSICLCAFVWVGFRLRFLLMVLLVVYEMVTGEFLNGLVINSLFARICEFSLLVCVTPPYITCVIE